METTETKTTRTITELDEDALVNCASYLEMEDIASLSMTCKYLRRVSFSDSVWLRWFREHWPHVTLPNSGVREAYFARQMAVKKFKFCDPYSRDFCLTAARPVDHVIMDKDNLVFSQGPEITIMKIDELNSSPLGYLNLNGHNARITCMRLFPIQETSLSRGETRMQEKVLVTSSSDHSIRLWWKGCQRCFRGHNGPVLTLSDKLLGDVSAKVLASGGEDGTVRLWSLSSSGKHRQHALKATLYGHEKPVKFVLVAGHKPSLLVTISNDSKVRAWDTAASSAIRSSCCVGMTTVSGALVDMKCHESLVYVAAGTSIVTIDLRTMQKVLTLAVCQPKIFSFAIVPAKFSICTGGNGKAMLWDIRKNQNTLKPEPLSELDGHKGPVTLLHMDHNKVVTGGPKDECLHVWDADDGSRTNSLFCYNSSGASATYQYSAMAVYGTRICAAGHGEQHATIHFNDFFNAMSPIFEREDELSSKFWCPQSLNDSDTDSQEFTW